MGIGLGASVIVFDRKGRVLIEQRDDLRNLVFPGGGLEEGETLEQVAIRETKEETGIKIKIKKLVAIALIDTWLIKRVGFVYVAEKVGGRLKIQPGETVAVRFVDKSELKSLLGPWHLSKLKAAIDQDKKIKILRRQNLGILRSRLPLFIWRRWLKKRFFKTTLVLP
jgi:8-oxo-dGTP pyrophosphatase MutT (NUDIX family)